MRPGTPTTTQFSGTSRTTTEPAPIRLPAPMVNAADHLGARADHDVVADGGVALLPLEARATQGHALEDAHVPADLGGLADDDAHAVIDEEPGAQHGGGMDLDTGQETGHVETPSGRPDASRPASTRGRRGGSRSRARPG